MPQQPILFYDVFDVWGIDFMGHSQSPMDTYTLCLSSTIQTVKLKYSTTKSRKHCKRWPIPTGTTRANSLRMLYGHTDFIGDVSLLDYFRQAMQPSLRPSRQLKEAPTTRIGRTLLGSIRELLDL
ncbi:hypothetical protein CR513_29729, partial [Mucuna pruriens]